MKAQIAILILSVAAVSASCHTDNEDETNAEANELYEKICRAVSLYTDSLAIAGDSAAVDALMERYGDRMDAINYEALPDTDYHLNEAQNDTIAMLMDSLIVRRNRRLEGLAAKVAGPIDSIGGDSAALPK
ncbi:MAG: hypothetical protein K2H21_00660 [Muribaculaceae bacterium]|nr:hypothetical protein [Muribaculaceae bacterium]